MRIYRVDRMKDVRFTSEPREGKEAFAAIDLKTYSKEGLHDKSAARNYGNLGKPQADS